MINSNALMLRFHAWLAHLRQRQTMLAIAHQSQSAAPAAEIAGNSNIIRAAWFYRNKWKITTLPHTQMRSAPVVGFVLHHCAHHAACSNTCSPHSGTKVLDMYTPARLKRRIPAANVHARIIFERTRTFVIMSLLLALNFQK